MLGSKPFIPAIKQGRVKQEFDFVHETDRTTICGQVKCKSLDELDRANYDDEDDYVSTVSLERWGDRRIHF